jgi:hypothetical protein
VPESHAAGVLDQLVQRAMKRGGARWLRGLGKRAHQVVEVRRPRACRQSIADRPIEGDQRHRVALAGQNVGQGRKERCRVVQLADITASPVHRA